MIEKGRCPHFKGDALPLLASPHNALIVRYAHTCARAHARPGDLPLHHLFQKPGAPNKSNHQVAEGAAVLPGWPSSEFVAVSKLPTHFWQWTSVCQRLVATFKYDCITTTWKANRLAQGQCVWLMGCSYRATCHSLDVCSVYPPASAVMSAKRREGRHKRKSHFCLTPRISYFTKKEKSKHFILIS